MELTGKCKEDFDNWFKSTKSNVEIYVGVEFVDVWDIFYQLPEAMQWGVLVDFFDSKGVLMYVERYWDLKELNWSKDYYWCVSLEDETQTGDGFQGEGFNEARIEAIEKANEIYNSTK